MSVDTIANMLSMINNASMVGNKSVIVPHSKQKEEIAKVLEKGGFLTEVKVFKEKGESYKKLRLDVAYEEDESPKISKIRRVSKPGRRVYRSYEEIRPVAANLGFYVVSTSRGILNSIDAKKKKLGGEIICEVF